MKEELIRQAKNEPTEFNLVKMNISNLEDQIAGFIRQLRSIFCFIQATTTAKPFPKLSSKTTLLR